MSFAIPKYSRNQVNRAGDFLIADNCSEDQLHYAFEVLANWRASHGYPINTFQATLRQKLKAIDDKALVAQRLKRTPSIIAKLQRFTGMNLARMQDIGGLRAVVSSISKVRQLENAYKKANFKHKITSSDDYINFPKADGYRSIHLIFRYFNDRASAYNGLSLELQLRTRFQHAWATAVETMGTFLGQALKSGQGDTEWRNFFTASGSAMALLEKTAPVPGYEGMDQLSVFTIVAQAEKKLNVLNKLRGFAIATDKITTENGKGAYHLVVLNSA